MRWNDVRIEACALRLGHLVPVDEAVSDGRYDAKFRTAHGYHTVSDAGDATSVDLAAEAVAEALKRSGSDPEQIDLLVYACCGVPPEGIVTPASAVQGRSIPTTLSAVEVSQGCNSGIAALEITAGYLTAAGSGSVAAMVTTDKFRAGHNRYTDDPGSVPGDGAAALLLNRTSGYATLLSTVILGDGRLENPPLLRPSPGTDRREFIKEQRKRLLPILRARLELQKQSVEQALSEAGLTAADIDRWVFPNTGEYLVDESFRAAIGAKAQDTTWEWGRTVGHMDASDQTAGLAHLMQTRQVRPGGHVALVGNGVGVTYGCAVVRIDGIAPWSAEPAGSQPDSGEEPQ